MKNEKDELDTTIFFDFQTTINEQRITIKCQAIQTKRF